MGNRHTLNADVILRRVNDGIEEGGLGHSYTYLVVRIEGGRLSWRRGSQGTDLMTFQSDFRDMRDWGYVLLWREDKPPGPPSHTHVFSGLRSEADRMLPGDR